MAEIRIRPEIEALRKEVDDTHRADGSLIKKAHTITSKALSANLKNIKAAQEKWKKKVYMYYNGLAVAEYDSITEAAKDSNVSGPFISAHLRGISMSSRKLPGYTWKYRKKEVTL